MNERLHLDQTLDSISRAMNTLAAEIAIARKEDAGKRIYILAAYTDYLEGKKRVHVSSVSWVSLCGIFRDYEVRVHGDYDKDKEWSERDFKLSFYHSGVEYFCLMSGTEMTKHGIALPLNANAETRQGGATEWLEDVQSTNA